MLISPSRGGAQDQGALALADQLVGTVERVTFHNEDTGFCVLQVKARGHRRSVTVVGQTVRVGAGEVVQASGAWGEDRHHGVQFQAVALELTVPTTAEDLQRFLGSGLIKGVGPVGAQRLVAAFGTRVLEVIETAPHDLARVNGIGLSRAQAIAEAWAEHRALRDIMAFLRTHGVAGAHLMRIYRLYGAEAVDVITANPYRLTRDIPGLPFESADRIADHLRVDPRAPARMRAGLVSALGEAVADGHCGLPAEEVIDRASDLLSLPKADVEAALKAQCAQGALVSDEREGRRCIFPRALYGAELYTAVRLRELAEGLSPWGPLDPEEAVARAEARLQVRYSASQREALLRACGSKALVVTGGPGVGKTTLVRGLLEIMGDRGVPVLLCAPTGRAARRLQGSTGHPARTIHRLLEAGDGAFRRGAAAPLDCGLLVVDEASMVDIRLMTALLRALPDGAGLLLVGDADQLPSIGPGQVLSDIIASGALPVAHLTEVFRQEAQSGIIAAAHAINRGAAPDLAPKPDSDFYFVEAAGPEETVAKLVTLVRSRIPTRFGLDPVRDVQVLCPMNRGPLGSFRLNRDLQALLNPPGERAIQRAGWTFGPGDKVMQVRNDYERDVSNGEVGIVASADPARGELDVLFEGRKVIYTLRELDDLTLAYATTIHKAQGSEYPAVVIPITPQHAPMLGRKLLYTGVTRASRLLVLVGSRDALLKAVTGSEEPPRWSRLRHWLEAPPGRDALSTPAP